MSFLLERHVAPTYSRGAAPMSTVGDGGGWGGGGGGGGGLEGICATSESDNRPIAISVQ